METTSISDLALGFLQGRESRPQAPGPAERYVDDAGVPWEVRMLNRGPLAPDGTVVLKRVSA